MDAQVISVLKIISRLNIFLGKLIQEYYSSPSLNGHSQQRLHSLIRPYIFPAATINVFTSPSHQRPPL